MKRGIYIFEGIDGSGKSTQAELLEKYLQPEPTMLLQEPGGTTQGNRLRQILKNSDYNLSERDRLYLYCLSRYFLCETINSFKSMNNIILDRFIPSTFAYQKACGVTEEAIIEYHQLFCPKSLDIMEDENTYVIYIDIDPEKSLDRISSRTGDKDVYENLETLKKVRQNYLEYLKSGDNVVIIDGNKPKFNVFEDVKKYVDTTL